MRFNPEINFGKKNERSLNPEADFSRHKEGFEFQNSFEKLNIYTELAIRINDLYNKRLLGKQEAEMLMGYLRKYSEGRDKNEAVKLIAILDDADLYLKEKLQAQEVRVDFVGIRFSCHRDMINHSRKCPRKKRTKLVCAKSR